MANNKIVIVGSCMIDFVSYAPRLPKQGETIHGTKFVTTFGGKGANQCVAAAKLGGQTTLVARLGDDIWGDQYIENLKSLNVETKYVQKTAQSTSGIAQINVSDAGDNQIVIVAGANNLLGVKDVDLAQDSIREARVVVLQLETSVEVAIATLKLSKGVSILNGAPALSTYDPLLLTLPSIFCVNETEASVFTGLSVNNLPEAKIAAKHLIAKGCKSVLLTLGSQGVIYIQNGNPDEILHVQCPKVTCVDSTGAGDAFLGAFAFFIANYDLPIDVLIKNACLVASDSVTRPGTQISFPERDILENCSV